MAASVDVHLTLITGPVRSGKSRLAEQLAGKAGGKVTYIATAAVDPDDPEWCARLDHHRRRRPALWDVVETAAGLGEDLRDVVHQAEPDRLLLIDSLGTWLADRMSGVPQTLREDPLALEAKLDGDCETLLDALLASPARSAILIGEETGWGIVPMDSCARVFRDVLGRLHQRVAAEAEHVYLTVSGIALDLRATGSLISDLGSR